MAFNRRAEAVWNGSSQAGGGTISFKSGALPDVPYSFGTRFGEANGTNPEELLAAAHAACFSMALAHVLTTENHPPTTIATQAVCTADQIGEGFKITKIRLRVTGSVPGIDAGQFVEYAKRAEASVCVVSQALRNNVEIVLEPELEQ